MSAPRSAQKITFIVFVGGSAASPAELMLSLARQAIARDTIEKALSLDLCGQVIVATDAADFAAELASLPVIVELDSTGADNEPFHFGQRLRDLIRKHDARHPFYIGGGSAPLLAADEIRGIARDLLSQDEGIVITNNLYSTDFAAFTPGQAIDRIAPPDTDNNLAFALHHQGGMHCQPLPQTAATLIDVDTPTDLLVLSLWLKVHSGFVSAAKGAVPSAQALAERDDRHRAANYAPVTSLGRHTRAVLNQLKFDTRNLEAVVDVMNDASGQLILAGRLGATAWAQLERNTACRTRVFSEERGMRAAGREGSGQVRSLLGAYLEIAGATSFFARLADMGDAALIDTRVIFEHFGLHLTAADRFNSDLLRVEEIVDPFLREFTAAALLSPIPVVLGGHSLVAGGVWALVEAAQVAKLMTTDK